MVEEYAQNMIKCGLRQGFREIFAVPDGVIPGQLGHADAADALLDEMPKLMVGGAHINSAFYRAEVH